MRGAGGLGWGETGDQGRSRGTRCAREDGGTTQASREGWGGRGGARAQGDYQGIAVSLGVQERTGDGNGRSGGWRGNWEDEEGEQESRR